MNDDIFEGKWKQIRGEAKAWWGKLTDDDLDRAAGKMDVLAGMLQEKYGYSHQRATDEINKHVTEFEASLKKNLNRPENDWMKFIASSLLKRGCEPIKTYGILCK